MALTVEELAQTIDHTVLKPETTRAKIKQLCEEAMDYNFAAVCINAVHVEYAVELLKDTDVKVCCVVGFPLGATLPEIKAAETRAVVELGAHEVDMVMNIGALRSGDHQAVAEELRAFKQAAGGAVTKCILEVCYLIDEEIATATKLVAEAGIDFVKTSSGQFQGPSLQQFLVMRDAVRDAPVRLKVAGVKFPRPQNAMVFLRAGADRLGTRAGPEIVDSLEILRDIGLVPD